MSTFPSENILKLRELTNKICDINNDEDYKDIVLEIKYVVEEANNELKKAKTIKNRVVSYEKMCETLQEILKRIN
jgi:hypothetical protein